ncbi:hypothetical protein RHSP_50969 [Rhizobium freirei PRF 81]|uniref:Uncharacterized protein n=1 Tax=Rhizobium freirei PRF 81 TaxID=363754 RepID=N6V2G4_9HYPH|nr:hypothetical protein RHSP_50969 [Rhizobium freirei PRF 81]
MAARLVERLSRRLFRHLPAWHLPGGSLVGDRRGCAGRHFRDHRGLAAPDDGHGGAVHRRRAHPADPATWATARLSRHRHCDIAEAAGVGHGRSLAVRDPARRQPSGDGIGDLWNPLPEALSSDRRSAHHRDIAICRRIDRHRAAGLRLRRVALRRHADGDLVASLVSVRTVDGGCRPFALSHPPGAGLTSGIADLPDAARRRHRSGDRLWRTTDAADHHRHGHRGAGRLSDEPAHGGCGAGIEWNDRIRKGGQSAPFFDHASGAFAALAAVAGAAALHAAIAAVALFALVAVFIVTTCRAAMGVALPAMGAAFMPCAGAVRGVAVVRLAGRTEIGRRYEIVVHFRARRLLVAALAAEIGVAVVFTLRTIFSRAAFLTLAGLAARFAVFLVEEGTTGRASRTAFRATLTGAATLALALATTGAAAIVAAGRTATVGRSFAAGNGDLDAHQALDVAQQADFVRSAEGDGDAVAAGARGTADAVDIGVGHFRQVEVVDMRNAGNVDAAGGDVGGDENADVTITETLERPFALSLALVAVDGGGGEADMVEMLHQLLGTVLGTQEDDGTAIRIGGDRFLEDFGLVVLAGDEVDILLHLVGRLAWRRHFDLDRIGQVVGSEIGNRLRHGGRKQQGLALGRDELGDLAQVVDEAEVEHLVGLVEDEMGDVAERQSAAADEIEQAARGGDEDIGAALKLKLLLVDRSATDHEVDPQVRLAHEELEVVGDLVHQLAGRSEDQRADGAVVRTLGVLQQHFYDRQAEGGRLAGACLGEANEIAALENERDRLCLDRRRSGEVVLRQRIDNLLGETKRVKIGQFNTFRGRQSKKAGSHHAVRSVSGVKNPA